MSRLRLGIVVVAIAYIIYHSIGLGYEKPAFAQVRGDVPKIQSVHFDSLFEAGIPFSQLAEKGQYTVVEGYLPTCPLCKKLESEFPAFLNQRRDVVIRQVQFNSSGGVRFNATDPEEHKAQVLAYANRIGQYQNFHVDIDAANDRLNIGTCGTPHIEIYGPDQQLLIADSCPDGHKNGLAFLKKWMLDET